MTDVPEGRLGRAARISASYVTARVHALVGQPAARTPGRLLSSLAPEAPVAPNPYKGDDDREFGRR